THRAQADDIRQHRRPLRMAGLCRLADRDSGLFFPARPDRSLQPRPCSHEHRTEPRTMNHRPSALVALATVGTLLLTGLPLMGCSSTGSSSGSSESRPQTIGFAGFEQPLRELEEYDRPITRSTLRESAIELLETAAFEDSPLL